MNEMKTWTIEGVEFVTEAENQWKAKYDNNKIILLYQFSKDKWLAESRTLNEKGAQFYLCQTEVKKSHIDAVKEIKRLSKN